MELPLRPLFASIALPALLAGVCACSTAAAAGAASARSGSMPSTRTASSDAALLAFAKQIGVSCERHEGKLACIGGRPEVGDYADVDLHPECGADGWFGVINAKHPVELRNRISPLDTRTLATLTQGQPVCIRAIGQVEGQAFYYFATAVPKAAVSQCTANVACNPPTPPVIRWTSKKPVAACRADNQDSLRECASGWIQADELSRLSIQSQSR